MWIYWYIFLWIQYIPNKYNIIIGRKYWYHSRFFLSKFFRKTYLMRFRSSVFNNCKTFHDTKMINNRLTFSTSLFNLLLLKFFSYSSENPIKKYFTILHVFHSLSIIKLCFRCLSDRRSVGFVMEEGKKSYLHPQRSLNTECIGGRNPLLLAWSWLHAMRYAQFKSLFVLSEIIRM